MYKILLTNPIHQEALDLLQQHAEVITAHTPTPAAIYEAAEGCDGIIVRAQLPDGIFEKRSSLRVAVRHGTGLDFIPIPEATAQGVVVANVPGVNAASVAEHATLMMLGLARRTFRMVEMFKQDGWNPAREHAAQACEIHGCTVGIVGFGSVGRRIAAIWQAAFGARILVHTPDATEVPQGVHACAMAELKREADFVVLACPLVDETRGMVNAAFLAGMKPGAFLINVARGPIVVEAALIDALQSGRLGGAGVDVYEHHPLNASSPLLRIPNVIATPHCAGISASSLKSMGIGAVEEMLRALRGENPRSFVNPEVSERRRGGRRPWAEGLRSY